MKQFIFIDTDIVLDLLLNRAPFNMASARLFTLVQRGVIEAAVSSLTFANGFYLLRKKVPADTAKAMLSTLKSWITVLPVESSTVDKALASPFNDFEDALQYHAALPSGASVIITRNIRDFKNAALPVMTAEEFLAQFPS
jgi:predicted nucleic acid-binding protein